MSGCVATSRQHADAEWTRCSAPAWYSQDDLVDRFVSIARCYRTIQPAVHDSEYREIFRLRYEQYIRNSGKLYPGADHVRGEFSDRLDASGLLLFARSASDGRVAASVRLSLPQHVASFYEWNKVCAGLPDAVRGPGTGYVSRLVRRPDAVPNQTFIEIFMAAFHMALMIDVRHAAMTCAPHLEPLFNRFGFRSTGQYYESDYAGRQCILFIDMLDGDHFRQCRSPFARVLEIYQEENQ